MYNLIIDKTVCLVLEIFNLIDNVFGLVGGEDGLNYLFVTGRFSMGVRVYIWVCLLVLSRTHYI